MQFEDRKEAAQLLVKKLEHYRGQNPLVLAIPRGAVGMGEILTNALKGQLDVVLVHKLGAPDNPEFAIGSIDEKGEVYLTEYGEALRGIKDYLEQEKTKQLETLQARRQVYTSIHPPINPKGRLVIIVDDGVATGSTLIAAIQSIRQKEPAKIIAAMGVAPPDTVKKIKKMADEVVCLHTPVEFWAVGQFFRDFSQVSDEEVADILKRHR